MIPNRLLLLLRRPRQDNLTFSVTPEVEIFPGRATFTRQGTGGATWTRQGVGAVSITRSGPGAVSFTKPIKQSDATPIGDGLTHYLSLDETSGTRADSDGGNDLTEHNTVGSTAGVIGNAAAFVNANEEWLSGSQISLTGDWSISLWFQADSLGGTQQYGHGLIRSTFGEADGDFHIGVNQAGEIYCANYTPSRDNLTRYRVPSGITVSTGTPYHLAITYARASDTLLFYVDGNVQTTVLGSFAQSSNWGDEMSIGRTFASSAYYWDGWIDEVGIWDGRILTADEVTRMYNDGDGRSRDGLDLVEAPVSPGGVSRKRGGPGAATITPRTGSP